MSVQLNQSECVDFISSLESDYDRHTRATSTCLDEDLSIAEEYIDELIEAVTEMNHKNLTQRFEEKSVTNFTEAQYLRDMRDISEDMGDYVRLDFWGCVAATKRLNSDSYTNSVRYVWRGFFDKTEVIITVGIYQRGEAYHVYEARYR